MTGHEAGVPPPNQITQEFYQSHGIESLLEPLILSAVLIDCSDAPTMPRFLQLFGKKHRDEPTQLRVALCEDDENGVIVKGVSGFESIARAKEMGEVLSVHAFSLTDPADVYDLRIHFASGKSQWERGIIKTWAEVRFKAAWGNTVSFQETDRLLADPKRVVMAREIKRQAAVWLASRREFWRGEPVSPEAALVRRARGNDPEAFGEIYERYYNGIYRYIYYRLGDQKLAESLVIEVFNSVRQEIDRLADETLLPRWLYGFASRYVVTFYKAHPDYQIPIEAQSLGLHQELFQALHKLPSLQRDVIIFKFVDGLSNDEVAGVLGISIAKVSKVQQEALTALGEFLHANPDFKIE